MLFTAVDLCSAWKNELKCNINDLFMGVYSINWCLWGEYRLPNDILKQCRDRRPRLSEKNIFSNLDLSVSYY